MTRNSYLRRIKITNGPDKGKVVMVDLYDLMRTFVVNPAHQQAIKKLLRGGRADKSWVQDMRECMDSIKRAIEQEEGK